MPRRHPNSRSLSFHVFAALLLAAGSLPTFAADDTSSPLVEEWKGRMSDAFHRSNYALSSSFANAIWDNVSDINLEQGKFGIFSHGIEVRRQVFDNHDIGNSYTVLDRFNIPTSLSLFSRNLTEIGGVADHFMAALGITLGTNQGLDLLHIRQVEGSRLGEFTQARNLKEEADEKAAWFISLDEKASAATADAADAETDGKSSANLAAPTPEVEAKSSLSLLDPLRRARYGAFWSRFTFPSSMPLTAERLARLNDGEVLSYNVYGAVQVGVSAGWALELNQVFRHLTGNLSYSVYLRGDYRISVLKENSRFARVKVTRTVTTGDTTGLNSETDQKDSVGGFVSASYRLLKNKLYLVPFQIQLDKSDANAFDVGYRYDLNDPRAVKAYELAVLGRFAFSSEIAAEKGPKCVEKIFSREQKITTEVFTAGVRFASFYRNTKSSSVTEWDAIVTLPDGTRHILTTDAVNRSEWKPFWGMAESKSYSFRISMDLDGYTAGRKDVLYMVAEGTLEDQATSGKALLDYERTVENSVGERGMFPRFPLYSVRNQEARPSLDYDTPPIEASYGYSTFYYRIVLNHPQLETFMSYPVEKMWPALEIAFGAEPGSWATEGLRALGKIRNAPSVIANVPLFPFHLQFYNGPKLGHAQDVFDAWSALKSEASPAERTRKLGRLFSDTVYSRELVKLLRVVLEGQEIPYIASGTNIAFGHIWKQGSLKAGVFPFLDGMNKEIDFDRYNDKGSTDSEATVSDINLGLVAGGYELTFISAARPAALYLRLVEDGAWRADHVLAEFIVGGGGFLKEGKNRIVMTAATGEPWSSIARKIEPGKRYILTLAVSRDAQGWGSLASTTYYTPEFFNR